MLTFDEFLDMEVRRTEEAAEIIVCYWQGDKDKPVRLIGFAADNELSDYEILESGFEYYERLKDAAESE